MTTHKNANLFNVALIGAGDLKGKEVADVLGTRRFPAVDIKLLDSDELIGQLDQVNDEPTFVQSVTRDHLENVDFTFLTSDAAFVHKVLPTVRESGSEIIDLSYALEEQPEARLRAPWVECELGQEPPAGLQSCPTVVAHPAACVLALLAARLKKIMPFDMVSAVIAQPASEYGRAGLDELHDQTANLFSFQSMPMQVFGAQSSFNIYAQSIEGAHPSLAEVEARVRRHYQAIAPQLPLPAIMLMQAPIFHGYAIALYVRMSEAVAADELNAALVGPHVNVCNEAEGMPSNINVPGSSGIMVSVRPDGAGRNGFWLFAVCDNLRVAALQAVECAEEMTQTRPRGQLQ